MGSSIREQMVPKSEVPASATSPDDLRSENGARSASNDKETELLTTHLFNTSSALVIFIPSEPLSSEQSGVWWKMSVGSIEPERVPPMMPIRAVSVSSLPLPDLDWQ